LHQQNLMNLFTSEQPLRTIQAMDSLFMDILDEPREDDELCSAIPAGDLESI